MSTRQDKVAKQIQKDMADILLAEGSHGGKMLTVTNTRITPDLALARIYISVFPSDNSEAVIKLLNSRQSIYRNALGQKIRHQLHKVPEIEFYLDDSLDYIENIDNLLKQ